MQITHDFSFFNFFYLQITHDFSYVGAENTDSRVTNEHITIINKIRKIEIINNKMIIL